RRVRRQVLHRSRRSQYEFVVTRGYACHQQRTRLVLLYQDHRGNVRTGRSYSINRRASYSISLHHQRCNPERTCRLIAMGRHLSGMDCRSDTNVRGTIKAAPHPSTYFVPPLWFVLPNTKHPLVPRPSFLVLHLGSPCQISSTPSYFFP